MTVEIAIDPSLAARGFNAVAHYAIGVAALPVALLQPQVAVGLPLYLVVMAPLQAAFNARVETLARVLMAEPLPEAVVRALRQQGSAGPGPQAAVQARLRLASYGLATRSGRTLEVLQGTEELCLVAAGQLIITRDGRGQESEDMAIGPGSTTRDLPPPLCAPMSRWAADDGRLLRQATREMAELLAALIADRAQDGRR